MKQDEIKKKKTKVGRVWGKPRGEKKPETFTFTLSVDRHS